MKKLMLIYPTGDLYQRGEDRCQVNINASISNSMRACNDLGYIASILKNDYQILLKDYMSEKKSFNDFKNDFISYLPDVLFISTTNGSIYEDLEFINNVKALKKDVIIILKGALFFNINQQVLDNLPLNNVDYLIGGEVEFIIKDLLNSHFCDKNKLKEIQGIAYKNNEKWIVNNLQFFNEDLDSLPFPDRSLMNNKLYLNPLNNKKMATISTSRGCPSGCIFCLSPVISGKKVRFRSPKSVLFEMIECFDKYKIDNFFFKADTFTINKAWVLELCNLIINSKLHNKIQFVANSRVNTIDEEMLFLMKKAGCSMIALGLESGSDDTLNQMKKGVTVQDNIRAVKLIKSAGIQVFGFYLIGFPFENKEHLAQTKKLIFDLDTDFIEVSIVTPFYGSELYSMLNLNNQVLGKDSFKNNLSCSDNFSIPQLQAFRKDIILKYHLRLKYILGRIFNKNINLSLLKNYVVYGFRLLKNLFY